MSKSLLSGPKLSEVIEGVETTFLLFSRPVRVVVTAEALQAFCDAGDSPASWLQAATLNTEAIEQAARAAFSQSNKATVVLQRL